MLTEAEHAARWSALRELIETIRPAVQSDGGDLVLVDADVETGVVHVELQGACSTCAISTTTMRAGVERILRDRLDWVSELVGDVDDTLDYQTSVAMGRGGYVPR